MFVQDDPSVPLAGIATGEPAEDALMDTEALSARLAWLEDCFKDDLFVKFHFLSL